MKESEEMFPLIPNQGRMLRHQITATALNCAVISLAVAAQAQAQVQPQTPQVGVGQIEGVKEKIRPISHAFGRGSAKSNLLEQMRAGTLSPANALKQGALAPDDVLRVVGLWGDWTKEGKALRIQLVGALAENAPNVLSLDALPPALLEGIDIQGGRPMTAITPEQWMEWKRIVGKFYSDKKDDQAVIWYEAALKDWQQLRTAPPQIQPAIADAPTLAVPEAPGQEALGQEPLAVAPVEVKAIKPDKYGWVKVEKDSAWVMPLAQLAMFYGQTGRLDKAGQTWERSEDYSKSPAWVADSLVEAGRVYTMAGEKQKAKAAYERIAQHGQGWYTGLALLDQASAALREGRSEEARELLKKPVTGRNADQIQVALSGLMAESYYRDRQFEAAQKYSRQALAQYKGLTTPNEWGGLQTVLAQANDRLGWVEKWRQSPLVCTPAGIRLVAAGSEGRKSGPVTQRLSIHAPSNVPITVTCEDERVTLGRVDNGRLDEFSYVRSVSVAAWIAPTSREQSFNTTLVVQSTKFPGVLVLVPLHVDFSAQ